jgi:peroxiredoxin Q/BCP
MTKHQSVSHDSRLHVLALAALFLLMPGVTLALEIGDQAPPFRLPGTDGATHQLSDYLGGKPVVLAFFPKAFTGG